MMVIEMNGVGFGYPGQAPILSGINLQLNQGDKVLVLGPNGSGKTTLALLIAGLLRPTKGRIFRPDGQKVNVGIVFQNSRHQMVGSTVEEDLAFGLIVRNAPPAEIRARVESYLQKFRLTSKKHCNVNQLSGGELRRLALAAVLITEPGILILDEPLAMLDQNSRISFLNCLWEVIKPETIIIWLDHEIKRIRYLERALVLTKEGGLIKATLADLCAEAFLKKHGLSPAPLQFLEWRFPGRISGAIFGPELVQID